MGFGVRGDCVHALAAGVLECRYFNLVLWAVGHICYFLVAFLLVHKVHDKIEEKVLLSNFSNHDIKTATSVLGAWGQVIASPDAEPEQDSANRSSIFAKPAKPTALKGPFINQQRRTKRGPTSAAGARSSASVAPMVDSVDEAEEACP